MCTAADSAPLEAGAPGLDMDGLGMPLDLAAIEVRSGPAHYTAARYTAARSGPAEVLDPPSAHRRRGLIHRLVLSL